MTMTDGFVTCDSSAKYVDYLPKSGETIQGQNAMEISGGKFSTAPDSSLISLDCVVDEDRSIVDAALLFDGTGYVTLRKHRTR